MLFCAFVLDVHAQVRKCVLPDGKIVYSDVACADTRAKESVVKAAPTSFGDVGVGAQSQSRERVKSMRLETIQLMLANGKLDEAGDYARTSEERSLVNRAAGVQAAQRKAESRAADEAKLKNSLDRRYKSQIELGNTFRDAYRDLSRRP